jgi:hypothetical protein
MVISDTRCSGEESGKACLNSSLTLSQNAGSSFLTALTMIGLVVTRSLSEIDFDSKLGTPEHFSEKSFSLLLTAL